MIFLDFGNELINLSQVYQVDVRDTADGNVVLVFFYHIAGSKSGGHKISRAFKNKDEAMVSLVSLGVNIRPVPDSRYDWRNE